MKVIGLIGGMTWESSLEYYRIINEEVKTRLGGFHSAKILMYSVDFQEVERQQSRGRWDESARLLVESAERLERGGADLLLICANTMHRVADEVESAVRIPLVHIADATAAEASRLGARRLGLLGTRYTMEEDFLKGRLSRHGLSVIVPGERSREAVHAVIYDELCFGKIVPESRRAVLGIIEELREGGAQAVVLGCTELPLLVKQSDTSVVLLDTTALHARRAVELALAS
ncbi:MAG: aspartate/glutamate racemase family protein [Candidatus Abyssubacteria bacterium]